MSSPEKKESFVVNEREGMKHVWLIRNLWISSKDLPVFEFEVANFDCFNEDVWFGTQHKPTVNKVLEHYRKIQTATFEYPIIFSEDGSIFDGVHRICRAYLDGRKTIPAVKFIKDPPPDQIIPMSQAVVIT
ncbi:hypothetical protein [Bdellovibrio sp. HCB288]|uniref:hypothetical protein n=1 Tax=Bdellovibrio sp. HCB288 TaxID=3394355 RepID=UPI0039B5D716